MRAIDADALDKFLEDAEIEALKMQRYVMAGALNTIRGNLRTFPAITPERKPGRWVESELYAMPFKCSECGRHEFTASNFCPKCGAEMRGEQDERY